MADVDLRPAYLITGSDRPKVDHALERLRRHFGAESTERVSALETSCGDVVALCNAGSLFGARRLVLVTDVDGVKRDNRLSGGWKTAEIEPVVGYLASPAPGTVLALVAEELKDDAPLAKAVGKHGQVLRFDVSRRQGQLEKWVVDRFKGAGVRAEPEAAKALVQIVGDDLHLLASEVEKIATWAAGEPVGETEVVELAAPAGDPPVYQVTDAWGRRDLPGLARTAESMVDRSERPPAVTIPIIASALARQVSSVRRAAALAEQSVSPREAMGTLGVRFEFQAKNLLEFSRNYGERELDGALVRVAELDHALKGGSRFSPAVELQRTLGSITRPPGRQARP
ncbi:MAG: DNA polymerase III subunit delta [Actinobacteria bacterium]|nr:DNA polymerase III subunit delta [Actinomycetota bacterium]